MKNHRPPACKSENWQQEIKFAWPCHVYKEVWCAAVGEELSCAREVNYRDPFAVAVVRSGVIVGHVPKNESHYATRSPATFDLRLTRLRIHFTCTILCLKTVYALACASTFVCYPSKPVRA